MRQNHKKYKLIQDFWEVVLIFVGLGKGAYEQ